MPRHGLILLEMLNYTEHFFALFVDERQSTLLNVNQELQTPNGSRSTLPRFLADKAVSNEIEVEELDLTPK